MAAHLDRFVREQNLVMAPAAYNDPLLPLVTTIVAAYVARNPVAAGELPQVIGAVYQALTGLNGKTVQRLPAVPVGKSVQSDFLICLEDGRQLKMLKRYLRTAHGLTPKQYRERWNLPADYPMVAPSYARKRSRLAKSIGLGTRPAAGTRAG